ncbi:hypothetical protein WJX74_004060 [Apatococcus lobatus]|uniref:Uncharacterized protein n=1 Tax=Apatococcus lobatus TaxID=904363 RepID=A0AAW1QVG1_9CHLO
MPPTLSSQAASSLRYHDDPLHQHDAAESAESHAAPPSHTWPRQNSIIFVLVMLHVIALCYWLFLVLLRKNAASKKAKLEPPRKVNCHYEWASFPNVQLAQLQMPNSSMHNKLSMGGKSSGMHTPHSATSAVTTPTWPSTPTLGLGPNRSSWVPPGKGL